MIDQTQTPLLSALTTSAARSHAPFYAPGHKRGQGASAALKSLLGESALGADLPELPELDNLFAPEGVIQEAQELAAATFGAEQTWFLANGSTCGLEAAIMATCGPGDKIVVPRNAHRSVISGLILAGAMPVYVQPEYDAELGLALGISAAAIATTLVQHPDIRAVLVVSPTYHGICSDIAAIAQLAHDRNLPLLVDEAHGAHFAFHPDLPVPALAQGADLVVQSTHKVLTALTQSSMLHVQGQRINRSQLQAALQLTQSTSPNYLLLASLDAARQQMAIAGQQLWEKTLALAANIRAELAAIPGLRVIDKADLLSADSVRDHDFTRLTVDVSGLGLTGLEADEVLHDTLGVTAELPEWRHMTFILTPGNTVEDGQRCIEAFKELAASYARQGPMRNAPCLPHLKGHGSQFPSSQSDMAFTLPPVSPREAFFAKTEVVPAAAAIGRLSAETIAAYPPGIPTILAGETIKEEAIAYLKSVKQQGGYVTGCSDLSLGTFKLLTL
jgi:arginine decarboxylase